MAVELNITRLIDVPPAVVWRLWTEPALIVKWFTPKPWSTVSCEIDLRPGGQFHTVMRSPEGEEHDNVGCILVCEPPTRLVFTDCLGPGFSPAAAPFFTGILTFEPEAHGTRYTARALHANEETAKKHAEMGFEPGWNKALDQLVETAKGLLG
jgi:uncharacterized protein YndB with AHSA1/START domain